MLAGIVSKLRRPGRSKSRGSGEGATPGIARPRIVLPADPEVMYAVGDVHGCLRQLLAVEDAIIRDGSRFPGLKLIVMMGDYVDRGPQSADVIEHLLQPPPEGFRRICLCGNHDETFLRFLDGQVPLEGWMGFGGLPTLLSYGVDLPAFAARNGALSDGLLDEIVEAIPLSHRAFLRGLPVSLMTSDYFFAHAGVRPGVALRDQSERDLLWIREEFLRGRPVTERVVVYGHSPLPAPTYDERGVGVDTGAYLSGRLSAARLRSGSVAFFQSV
ncbi:MAG: metallophosphoesterase family protein [Methylobacterium sp.]